MTGFIFFYNLSYSQSLINLFLVYPLHKSLIPDPSFYSVGRFCFCTLNWSLSQNTKVMLRSTASRPVCLGIKDPSGAKDQCETVAGLFMWRTGLSFARVTVSIRMLLACTIFILHNIKCVYIQNIQGLCQSRLRWADHALSLVWDCCSKLKLCYDRRFSGPASFGTKHPSGAYDRFYYCQAVAGLFMWGALSDERTGLSFASFTQQ
jgi:hypothetical protein